MDGQQNPAARTADNFCCLLLRGTLYNQSTVKWLKSLLTQQLASDFSTTNSRLALGKAIKLYITEMKMRAIPSSHRKGINPICGSRGFYNRDYEYWAQHASAQQTIVPCFPSSIKILSPNLIYVYFQFQGSRGYRGSQVCVFMCDQFSLRAVFCFLLSSCYLVRWKYQQGRKTV